MIATVLEIQRMSTEDGPGIRTTVFLKGCSLACNWCHNPESIPGKVHSQWMGSRCIGCDSCLDICSSNALNRTPQGISINWQECQGCGECAETCPSTALEMAGQKWELEALINEVIKDKAYFDQSDGGVTLSGGEPALQPGFAAAFFKALKEKGVQTALDSCGLCSKKALEQILPFTTMVLFDLKFIDSSAHLQFTGSGNERILENLLLVKEFMQTHVHPRTLWIRTPIIPGATDNVENIAGIGRFIAEQLESTVNRWELCSFNNLCKDKYQRLGKTWDYDDCDLITRETMEQLASAARASGVDPKIVHWTGSTKLEESDSIAEKKIRHPGC